jgi:MbtH protein
MADRVKVVRNPSGEYSIWPVDRENALGWKDVGKSGSEAECLRYIEEVWTDLRPLSVRQRSEKLQQMQQKISRDG